MSERSSAKNWDAKDQSNLDESFTVVNTGKDQISIDPTSDAIPKVRHLLVIRDEKEEERVITLSDTTYSIGRHPANSIVIQDQIVSRQHAILLRVPKPNSEDCSFRIIDGNLQGKRSQNGIWVNGRRCYSHDLRDQDFITFSETIHATYHQVRSRQSGIEALSGNRTYDTTHIDTKEQERISDEVLIRLSSFPEMTPHPIVEVDLNGKITYLNPAATRLFPHIRQHKDHPVRVGLVLIQSLNHDEYKIREIVVDGKIYEQSIHCIPQSQIIRSYLIDITQRRQMEDAVRQSEERYALAARGANDGLWDWDLEQQTIYLSPRWKEMIGYQEHDLSNQVSEWFDRVHPDDQNRVRAEIDHHINGRKTYFESEFRLCHKTGEYRYVRCRGMAVVNEQKQPIRLAGSLTDITEYHLAREQLLHDAFYDAMTGLPNRVLLLDRANQSLKKCKRHQHQHCAVLCLGLDRFKIINDSLGHMMGDKLLIEVSERLKECIRVEDTVARLGGDEFVVLIDNLKDLEGAIATASRIKQALQTPFRLADREIFTSASIGIALGNSHYEQPEDLLRDANAAMYQAKQQGKDSYAVFNRTMHTQAVALLDLNNDLRRAIDRKEFQLYYQPIIELKNAKICAYEALIRWFHPTRGLIPPNEFIPLAEETGLIIPLGHWLIREACEQLRQWQLAFPMESPLSMCINISNRQFIDSEFVSTLKSTLTAVPIAYGSLKLEITEGVVMQQPEIIAEKLLQLKELGIKLSIDDFGTGYSSLSYLQTFPVDTLKIDRSFVIKMGHPDSREIVKTIVKLAHNLGLDVVAEGVETFAQAQLLKAMNCEYVQGYYYSRPIDHQAAQQLLEKMLQPKLSALLP